MKYDEFVQAVAERTGTERDEAERTAIIVLQVLGDRLTGDEAFDLFAQLPARLKTSVTLTQVPMPMNRDEFVQRVASELHVDRDEARKRVRGVFGVLRQAVTWGELEDVILQLDPEYADLLA
jgi:uncharacterized protein (DUF2267 family)